MVLKLVVIPRGLYDRLIGMCDPKSREYDTLVNGFIIRNGNEEAVQIACDHAGTELILSFVRSRCPEMLRAITLPADHSH